MISPSQILQHEIEHLRRRNAELEARVQEHSQALYDSRVQLAQNEKMAALGQLAGGVAHEINNPLASILVFARTAARDLPADHPARKDMKEIEQAVDRCKKTVSSLLTFSRRSRPDKRLPIDLSTLVQQSLPLIEAATRCRVTLDLAAEVPTIEANAHRVQQVLLNLACNADQAMKGAGTATIRVYPSGGQVILEVQDEGPGIASESMPHVFEPFFTTKPQGQGTGLGLAIVYGIVREHAGEILVENLVSGGACFQARFPVMTPCTSSMEVFN